MGEEKRMIKLGEKGHRAYTRVREGKLQFIPQKGTVLKERKELGAKEASEVLGKDYERFRNDLDKYFGLKSKADKLKSEIESLAKDQEEVMQRLRPLLGKFENLSEEENKFKTEFFSSGFKHKFMSFPRETLPYKELFEESFKRLNAKMQEEVNGLKEQLKRITVQERFERVEKSDPWEKIQEHLKNIVRLKEEGVKRMKVLSARINDVKKSDGYVYVIL